jgi:hypothetical protein
LVEKVVEVRDVECCRIYRLTAHLATNNPTAGLQARSYRILRRLYIAVKLITRADIDGWLYLLIHTLVRIDSSADLDKISLDSYIKKVYLYPENVGDGMTYKRG